MSEHETVAALSDVGHTLLRANRLLTARIAALEAERDAARAEAKLLRDLLEEARWHVTVLRDEQGIASCSQCDLDARIEAALTASEQQP